MVQQARRFHDHRVTGGEVAHVWLEGWLAVLAVDGYLCVLHGGSIHRRCTHLLLLLVNLAELRITLSSAIELNLGLI